MTTIEADVAERLLAGSSWDAPRARRGALLDELEASGLTGRGGAGFPSARKVASIGAAGGSATVIVNAMEGEPASAKDQVLFARAGDLVIEGAALLAEAVGASELVVGAPAGSSIAAAARAAVARAAHTQPLPVLVEVPCRYLAGEESALVRALSGGRPLPAFRPDKSVPLRARRGPALVQNAETMAQIGLIARHGAAWFRGLGTPESPGTALVTVSGAVERKGVVEVPYGTSIGEIIGRATASERVRAVLVGGYGGTWLAADALHVPFAKEALTPLGATVGAGVVAVVGERSCGLREAARVARYLASESAGQCGPCVFGLPALADDLETIADGLGGPGSLERLVGRCRVIDGRGACRHPDGAARMALSALVAFSSDLDAHLLGRPCQASRAPSVLRFPGAVTPGGSW